jgi:hypothetical protein
VARQGCLPAGAVPMVFGIGVSANVFKWGMCIFK